MSHKKYFALAMQCATLKKDIRQFLIGAVGIRKDGVIVCAYNSPTQSPEPCAHAEARLARKLDYGAVVYVARHGKGSGDWAMAKPCADCERTLRSKGVKRVYYTIVPNEFGTMYL